MAAKRGMTDGGRMGRQAGRRRRWLAGFLAGVLWASALMPQALAGTARANEVSCMPYWFTAVAAGGAHALALRSDGTVWAARPPSPITPTSCRTQKTRQQLERIRDLGGIVAPISNQQDIKDGRPGGPVPNDCPGSSKTWAQAYLNAVDAMGGRGVAIGTDFNGLAGQPGPRFGTFACPGIAEDEIRGGGNGARRKLDAERQRNGVRYQTPVSDFRNYRFKEMGGPDLYDMEEREIWEAIALYKSGTDPARANIPLVNTLGDIRTPWQADKVRNLAKGFRAERYEQLEDPTNNEQLAAFMTKVGQRVWTADARIRERFDREAGLRNLYLKIPRIWGLWHRMEGNNAPLIRSTAGRVEVAPGEFRPRDFDINLDGLAHYGMLPDFIQDLKNSGMGEADLQPLLRSAEEYIRVWEGAELARGAGRGP